MNENYTRNLMVDTPIKLVSTYTQVAPRPRKRPRDRMEVKRPLLKYVMFSGGPLDRRVERIPRELDGVESPDASVVYRDSGEMLQGYPRFDHISG